MSGLRSLGVCYLAAASVFAVAGAMSAHRLTIHEFSARLRDQISSRVQEMTRTDEDQMFREHAARLALAPPGPNDARLLAHANPPSLPQKTVTPGPLALAIPMPVVIAPDLPEAAEAPAPPQKVASAAPPEKAAPEETTLPAVERIAITERFNENLTAEMRKNFSLFLYVSKASSGPLAQRLYVFKKNRQGRIELAYDWAASTGREQVELTPAGKRTVTDTPRGYYELDPGRMYQRYHSHTWDQPMPYSMFFNWENHGLETGLAIHAASGADIAKLGSRASAGCVHLSPEHARQLYTMIRADYRGPVPRFAYDRATETLSNKGELAHDKAGHVKMADGYQVLIFIENFGGENVVAALD